MNLFKRFWHWFLDVPISQYETPKHDPAASEREEARTRVMLTGGAGSFTDQPDDDETTINTKTK